jgi:hypothetical protein
MSTVLKAVQELERQAGATSPAIDLVGEEQGRPVAMWAAVAVGGAVAVAIAFLVMRRAATQSDLPRSADPPVAAVRSDPPASVARVEPPPVARVEPPPASAPVMDRLPRAATEEAPWAHVDSDTVAAVAPATRAADAPPAARPPRANERSAAVVAEPVAAARPAKRPVQEAPPPRHAALGDEAPAAAPGVEVRAIDYHEDGDRSVTLRIAGSPSVRLREGESAQGIDVQLIKPDLVYLRRGGSIFVASLRQR